MPELPDIKLYIDCLERRIVGNVLQEARLASPFLLRTADPPLPQSFGRRVIGLRRLGKRIVIQLEGDYFLVLHLMIAGRLHWKKAGAPIGDKRSQCAFDFEAGSLVLTEAGSKRRASLHLVQGETRLAAQDPGGLEVLEASAQDFRLALRVRNHTLKRALTDPRLLSGIGNAYSDEILHRAQLSPIAQTHKLDDASLDRLHVACVEVLTEWTRRLQQQCGDGFPQNVTAFRDEMAVHGRYRQPCPRCGAAVQRIRYAKNETNYCPTCQTDGKLLADRALSRLLKKDWPRSLEELEELKASRKG